MAVIIIPKRKVERQQLRASRILRWTVVQARSANVEMQVHKLSVVPLLRGLAVQPCVSDILSI
jgi:hypothetical protein